MRCARCDSTSSKVVDSRSAREGRAVRRRRECLDCGWRFTTYEQIESRPPQVGKREGGAEPFARDKVRVGIAAACAKRPVSADEIEALVDRIEDLVTRSAVIAFPSSRIGEEVMKALKPLDRVAYIRYASVYRNFQRLDEFQEAVDELIVGERHEARARGQHELALPTAASGEDADGSPA